MDCASSPCLKLRPRQSYSHTRSTQLTPTSRLSANGTFCLKIPTANDIGTSGPRRVSLVPTEAMNQTGVGVSKRRQGARGMPKVKSGCRTCKTRRKKCDEKKPACARCIQGGWHCDFLFVPMHERIAGASTVVGIVEGYNPLGRQEDDVASWTDTSYVRSPRKISVLPSHLRNLNWLQTGLFDYFRAYTANPGPSKLLCP
ncbi:uncharacterized protein B0J16DRAFT_319365 [Fusarium flagelliforme]|uniref:uncharacterized protein n=1 Tax=Fusarium flagelliforme TaxID=2675880 RepID=UPI001E8D9198|nr:uncharacterized protein B0J16DRAFT_319365 [Fusarium flagelliforme]KAH7184561.1 hypothetical protein B0J16DRAFT_319365 [Fusarium flagelliforme]